MLQAIRDKATGWIAWAVIILISVPFALWGINEYFSPTAQVAVATVDGEPIDYRELQRAVSAQRTRVRAAFGSDVDEEIIREAALDGLIDERVLVLAALEGGMRIGDAQLVSSIRNEGAFADDAGFSQARYESVLASQGMTPQGYEQFLRTSLLTGQLRQAVAASTVVPPEASLEVARLQLQTRTMRTLRFDAAKDADEAVSDADLAAYYEANKADFRSPPTVNFEYVSLDRAAMAEEITVDEAIVRSAYEQEKANYTQAEQRAVRHILVEVAEDADEAAVAAARASIDAIRTEIEAGAEFEKLAADKSDDIGSASQGGSLGVVGKDVFDPAFEKVAFAAEEGVLSEPVRTPFGWHLIRVDAITAETTRSFEDMREELEEKAKLDEADSVFYEQLDRLANLGFENPDSLEPAATELALPLNQSGFVSREAMTPEREAVEGIAAEAAVLAAAFDEVREAGTVSEAIEVGESMVVMLRVLERRPATDRPLDTITSEVRTALLAERRVARAREAGLAALGALREGKSPEEVAPPAAESEQAPAPPVAEGEQAPAPTAAEGEQAPALAWSEPRDVARRDAQLDRAVVDALFKMPQPSEDKPLYDGVEIGTEAFVIVELSKVDTSVADELEKASDGAEGRILAQVLERSLGNAELQAYAVALREAADVNIIDVDDLQHYGGGYGGGM